MNTKRIVGLSAAVLAFTLTQATPMYAMHHMGDKKSQCMMEKIEHLKASLNLTPDQEMKLKAIKAKAKTMMQTNHQEKKDIRKEAHQLADAKDLDQKKLDQLADKAGKLASNKLKNRVMIKHEINQVLTDDQKMKLKQAKLSRH